MGVEALFSGNHVTSESLKSEDDASDPQILTRRAQCWVRRATLLNLLLNTLSVPGAVLGSSVQRRARPSTSCPQSWKGSPEQHHRGSQGWLQDLSMPLIESLSCFRPSGSNTNAVKSLKLKAEGEKVLEELPKKVI